MSTSLDLHTSTTPKCSKKLPFTSSERELIVALVRDRPIIEDKRTHAKNIDLKKQAWEELTVAYNAQPYVSERNSMQLKRCWENIKTQRKKELSQDSKYMTETGGGPPQGDSSNNIVDIICLFIDLRVPKVIDSNSIEILDDLNQLEENVAKPDEKDTGLVENKDNKKRKRENDFSDLQECTEGHKKFLSETDARTKRCTKNMQQDQILHELRVQRETISIEREKNLMEFEKKIHSLQVEKLKLEIELLKNKKEN